MKSKVFPYISKRISINSVGVKDILSVTDHIKYDALQDKVDINDGYIYGVITFPDNELYIRIKHVENSIKEISIQDNSKLVKNLSNSLTLKNVIITSHDKVSKEIEYEVYDISKTMRFILNQLDELGINYDIPSISPVYTIQKNDNVKFDIQVVNLENYEFGLNVAVCQSSGELVGLELLYDKASKEIDAQILRYELSTHFKEVEVFMQRSDVNYLSPFQMP